MTHLYIKEFFTDLQDTLIYYLFNRYFRILLQDIKVLFKPLNFHKDDVLGIKDT